MVDGTDCTAFYPSEDARWGEVGSNLPYGFFPDVSSDPETLDLVLTAERTYSVCIEENMDNAWENIGQLVAEKLIPATVPSSVSFDGSVTFESTGPKLPTRILGFIVDLQRPSLEYKAPKTARRLLLVAYFTGCKEVLHFR